MVTKTQASKSGNMAALKRANTARKARTGKTKAKTQPGKMRGTMRSA